MLELVMEELKSRKMQQVVDAAQKSADDILTKYSLWLGWDNKVPDDIYVKFNKLSLKKAMTLVKRLELAISKEKDAKQKYHLKHVLELLYDVVRNKSDDDDSEPYLDAESMQNRYKMHRGLEDKPDSDERMHRVTLKTASVQVSFNMKLKTHYTDVDKKKALAAVHKRLDDIVDEKHDVDEVRDEIKANKYKITIKPRQ